MCVAGPGQQLLQLWGSDQHSLLLFTEPAGPGGHQALLQRAAALRMRVLHIPLPEAHGLSVDDAASIIRTCRPRCVALHQEQAAAVQQQLQQHGQQFAGSMLAYSSQAPLQLPLPSQGAAGEAGQAVQLQPGLLQQLELKACAPGASAAALHGHMQRYVNGTWRLGPAGVHQGPGVAAAGVHK